ncbi:LTA synthase family protein [Clostridium sp. DL1XJH146]
MSLVFSISLAMIFQIVSSLFKDKINYILSFLLLSISSSIFSSQLIYFKFFKLYYTVSSVENGGQVFEFWKDISIIVLKNSPWIIIFFIPPILLLTICKKILSFKKLDKRYLALLICSVVFTHLMGLAVINTGNRDKLSAYDLYYDSSYPILSVERLGLMTTMRLDLQRSMLGWSPTVEAISIDTVVDPSNETYSDDIPKEELEEIEYNIMDIDFDKIIANEDDTEIKEIHKYFKNLQPTNKNENTGKYEGYNLILITAESFSPYAINKEVTPTLYKLYNEGYKFTNYYNPLWGVSTTDGEYVACTSLIPKVGAWSFKESGDNYLPFVMGNQLNKLDYKSLAYHNHSYTFYDRNITHPNMGYTYKGVGNGLKIKKSWPESDVEMMEVTIPEYIEKEPFHAYYMTVSGHMQYNFFGNMMAIKNKDLVEELPYSTAAKAYLATQIELDRALEYLLVKLEESGIADKTLIAISPDHYPYGLEKQIIDELVGHEVEENFELYKSAFIIYAKDMEPITVDKPCSSLDILPTISNLLGLEYDSRLLMGNDIFSNSEPCVIFSNRSFITDKGKYNAETKEFIPNGGVTIKDNYFDSISKLVDYKFYLSEKILDTDYYRKILDNNLE